MQRRFALDQQKTLKQRDVFVFFNREGAVFALLLVITFIAGINYANNLILALCFLLLAVLVLSFYLAFWQLYGLNVRYEVAELAQVGQSLQVQVNLQPRQRQTHLQLRLTMGDQARKISVLAQSVNIPLTLMPQARGAMRLPRIRLFSVYPLGIVRAWSLIYPQHVVWVAPEALPLELERFGFAQLHQAERGGDDFSHLREYQTGDAPNRIAWQHYARGRGVMVRQFEQAQGSRLHFDYRHMPAVTHEERLGQLMYLVEQADLIGAGFALSLPSQQLPYGQGAAHVHSATLMLAQEP